MAHTKSAKKSIKQNEKRRLRNKSVKTEIKTLIKKCLVAAKEKRQDELKQLLGLTYSKIDKAAKKNIIHKNSANRKKSRLMNQIKAFSTA
ncbi:MAG: 30S ribosomal protein S20 [Candidatus Hydrogenedentota bacterium]